MEQTWIIAKNGYGYHDVSADPEDAQPDTPEVPDPGETPDVPDTGINNEGNGNNNGNNGNGHSNGNNGKGNKKTSAATSEPVLSASLTVFGNNGNGNNGNNGSGNGNQDKPTGSDVKKTSTVVKQFVVDFSREDFKPLMEHEVNGLDYRYVNSDKARLSVVVQGIENGSASLLDAKGELHALPHGLSGFHGLPDQRGEQQGHLVDQLQRVGRDHAQRRAEMRPAGAGLGERICDA